VDGEGPFACFDDVEVVDACCCSGGCAGGCGGPGPDSDGLVVGAAVAGVGAVWAVQEVGCCCGVGGDDGGDEGLGVGVEHEEA